MRVAAFIPIKLNSERLADKNIKPFHNGKPLINYILDTALKIKKADELYVYCSSEKIKDYLPEQVKFLKRPENLDLSSTSITEVIQSFMQAVRADIYILLHATSPFIGLNSIEKGLNAVMNDKYDSALAVAKHNDFLWQNGKPVNYDLKNIPRTQDLEPFYIETSGFYIFTDKVAKQKRRIGDNPLLVEISEIEKVDIDESIDFEIANAIYNYIINPINQPL